uniref:RRM domain-containing protein n=1 Tax=Caenorhabditis japonica TaxID=281687 RepID=A0A8R1DHF5_CAEJA
MRCIRWQLAKAIEKALAEAPGIPLIYHLFDTQDSMGTPQARLSHVLRQMRISNFVKNVHKMKDTYWKSLSQFTTMFTIENEEDDGSLFLKFTPIFDKKAATIYVDNLPEGCNEEKLMRLAKCYGNVAHLKIARKTPRMVRPRYFPARKKQNPKVKTLPPKNRHFHRNPPKKKKLIDVGSRPLSYGFIRFCDPESARKMIEAFTLNDPSIPFENHETQIRRQNEELAVEMLEFGPGDPENPENSNAHRQFYLFQRPFSELAMTKLIREIEFLKRRRRRRSWPMFHRLEVLRRRLRGLRTRELQCRVKAGLMRPFYRRKGKRQRKQEFHGSGLWK